MGVARRRLLPIALALAVIGCITFMFGDLTGNHPIRAGGAAIVGVAVLIAVAGQSLRRAGFVADQLQANEGAQSIRRDSAGAVAPSSSGRRLFIISRDHPKLYERAFKAFGGTRDTQVIYDRRRGQRRRGEPASATERRRGDRRQRTDVDFDIKAYGSAMVRP